jgi:hypothetical protein
MKTNIAAMVAALGLAVGLSACETATPYQPLTKGSSEAGGFTEQKQDDNHYRVTFAGNSLTSRDKVETYLLYRSAELTVSSGFDWFETVDRHTERDRRTYVDPGFGPYGYWHPYWRYYGGGFGWRAWGPYYGDPFFATDTVQKFEASQDIVMHHGAKPADNPRGLDAREVMTNLGPKIQRPGK